MAACDERLENTLGGKYRITRFLAEGGMGAVYEAQHLVVKRRFAVKFLHATLAQRRDALARFQREAGAAGALEGENIAAVIDFGMTPEGAPYIVMEYLDGVDLSRLLGVTGPLPIGRAADLVVQACRGIEEAHAAGVIHRDLKPSNLIVCRRTDGTDLLKIVDFGVAKLLASDPSSTVTRTGSMIGTPSYMSPEQARGDGTIDQRTDIHALGVILYELLSGHLPHPGGSANAVIHHTATQPASPLSCEGREFPAGLVDVVHRALAARPADRQASAAQFLRELVPFATREIWPAVPRSSSGASLGDDASQPAAATNAVDEGENLPGAPAKAMPDGAVHATKRGRLGLAAILVAAGTFALWRSVRSPDLPSPSSGALTSLAHEAREPSAVAPSIIPSQADEVPVPSLVAPTMSAGVPLPAAPNELGSAISNALHGRPNPVIGRPSGRSPRTPDRAADLPKPADSGGRQPAFDTRNPFE